MRSKVDDGWMDEWFRYLHWNSPFAMWMDQDEMGIIVLFVIVSI